MSGEEPKNKLATLAKMVGVCAVCVGVVYGLVALVTSLTS